MLFHSGTCFAREILEINLFDNVPKIKRVWNKRYPNIVSRETSSKVYTTILDNRISVCIYMSTI